MDKSTVILLLCLAGCCAASNMQIFGPKERTMKVGQSLQLICQVDLGLEVILNNVVQWTHVSQVDNTETVLTQSQYPKEEGTRLGYNVSVQNSQSETNFTLSVTSLTDPMDGKYICSDVNKEHNPADVEVVIASEVQTVQLTFDEEVVKNVDKVTVQREEGEFEVKCTAKGFSPSAAVNIFIGEQQLETAAPEIKIDTELSQAVKARRYMATVSIDSLKLEGHHDGQILKCEAAASFDEAISKVASMPLKVIVLEPEIMCSENTSAMSGDKYIEISCLVTHTNVNVKAYHWEIDGKDVTLDNNSYNHVKTEPVKDEEEQDKTTLELYEVTQADFDKTFVLVVELENGEKFEKQISLLRKGKTSASATRPAGYFLGFLLSLLLSL